jgi:hypothetical protein
LLLIGGFAAFLATYLIYARFLGGIDGLTPLPEAYWPVANDHAPPPMAQTARVADQMLQQAFGEACEELQRDFKLEARNRTMVLSANDVATAQDGSGRVELRDFSLALFGKSRGAGGVPEINTVKSDKAFLTFDQPIANLTEMAGHKIISAELLGDIKASNNRRTLRRDDDLHMHTKGPMYYEAKRDVIFTGNEVELTDFQSKPEPTRVTAKGMDIYLITDAANKQASAKSKINNISGVQRVELRANVRMDLFVDSRSGFLATGNSTDKKPAPQGHDAPADKTKVVIWTAGPFSYDVEKDHARFEIPHWHNSIPENVEVKRLNDQGKVDQLFCDALDIQFHRKAADEPKVPGDDRAVSLEIQYAHATGSQVILTSDTENLDAWGNELFYDALKRQTILKGTPEMVAMKDGDEIFARELWMQNSDTKETQAATAKGPGHIRMLDKNKGQRNIDARWTDELIYKKEGEFNCLTLTGAAAFEDKESHQRMQAERIKVWLQPEKEKPVADHAEGDVRERMHPHRVEAQGHVTADSAELHIKEPTESLAIWFRDAPRRTELPQTSPETSGNSTAPAAKQSVPTTGSADKPGSPNSSANLSSIGSRPKDSNQPGIASIVPSKPTDSSAPKGGPPTVTPEKPKPPIELCARSVVVHVVRQGEKNDLEQLSCDGAIHVHQDPASAEEKGMEIRGENLKLDHSEDGSVLVVTGTAANLAFVQFDKLAMLGPEVNVDQRENKAWVNGVGAMQMLTETNFEGTKLPKPTELTVHWKQRMYFNGKWAEFHGGVQAEQQTSRLLCQDMQVNFDHPISLKQEEKGKQQAKVERMVCDKGVQVEDITQQNGKLQSYRFLKAPELNFDNEDGVATAPGPGEIRIFQLGDAGDGFPGPERKKPATNYAPPAQPKQEFKITHVKFAERMQANNKARTANFYGNVEAVNVPADRPDMFIDPLNPPEGCLYLRCERLKVYTRELANGQKSQEMEGYNKVSVRAREFYGFSDIIKYDESQDRVIFEAAEGGQATLYRVKTAGAEHETLTGKKIYYWRKTNDFKVESARTLNVAN